jgi:hypothetical protein
MVKLRKSHMERHVRFNAKLWVLSVIHTYEECSETTRTPTSTLKLFAEPDWDILELGANLYCNCASTLRSRVAMLL